MFYKGRQLLIGSAFVTLLSYHGLAAAQTSQSQAPGTPGARAEVQGGAGIEDIVVTASRRSESVQSVPISIAVVTADSLEAQNIGSLQGLTNAVPGLQFSAIGPQSTPYLRGVGNNSVGPGVEAAVSTFVDGVYISGGTGLNLNFNNISSIEVVKGPQGTLFGRNSTGGVVLINTRTPQQKPAVEASVGYGNYDTVQSNLYVTGGLGANVAADLAVAYLNQGKGWGKNLFTGSDVYTRREFGIRSKILWNASDRLDITLAGDYSQARMDIGTSSALGAKDQFQPISSTTVYTSPGFYNVELNLPSFSRIKQGGASLRAVYDADSFQVTSISAYRQYRGYAAIDADLTPVSLIEATFPNKEQSISQELLLTSADSTKPLQWTVGAYYYYNDGQYRNVRIFGDNSVFVIPQTIDGQQITKSISGFGQLTYLLGEKTHLIAGLRYTSDKRTADGRSCGGPTQLFGGPACIVETDAAGVPGKRKLDFAKATWRLGIDHELTDNVLGYATYSRGSKSGFFNISTTNDPGVRPEVLDAFEVGFKSDLFDRHVRLNVSGYYYDYKNLQVQTFQGTSFVVRNAAAATLKGVDVDLTVRPTQNFRLNVSAQYLDATYKSFNNGPIYIPLSITTPNPFYGFGGNLQSAADLSGNRLVNAPKLSLAGTIEYDVPTSVGDFTLFLAPNYRSTFYFDPGNQGTSRERFQADASIYWTSVDKRLNARLWVSNLTNVKRPAAANVVPEGTSVSPLPPRTYGVTLGFKM